MAKTSGYSLQCILKSMSLPADTRLYTFMGALRGGLIGAVPSETRLIQRPGDQGPTPAHSYPVG